MWIVFFKILEILLKISMICTDLKLHETPIFYISFSSTHREMDTSDQNFRISDGVIQRSQDW